MKILEFLKDLLEKWRKLFCKEKPNNVDAILKQLEKIMAKLQEITDSLDELQTFVATVDTEVEALYEQIKVFTTDGITPEVADALLVRIKNIRDAVEKVRTDDEPTT